MSCKYILNDVDDRLATITLNRLERRNALGWTLPAEMSDAKPPAIARATEQVQYPQKTEASFRACLAAVDSEGHKR